ncbi:short-chain dehydrogenase [Penicillium maclennaniae]|uniref:short-chain dehydrogenase n=1 Tax=Penicillium maclennaniae TaxID=1343394 RepID=UPI00253FFDF7|nr:short-chain dehydrogenase [Penicillium maclennaniae]KAJ5676796.1 short-chain dehydrogenase [Penicillium maclennaniae]
MFIGTMLESWFPPQGSKTVQGYELQLGTNCIAPFLFTQCLYSILLKTAKIASRGSVRVVWLASSAIGHAPIPAIDLDNMDYERDESAMVKYGRSKYGNVLYAVEAARRDAKSGEGIVHVSVDPGIYMTDLVRISPWWLVLFFKLVSPAQIYGGYTELFAGLHPSITERNNGCWVIPYGKIADCKRADLWDETLGKNFWNWTYQQVKDFL